MEKEDKFQFVGRYSLEGFTYVIHLPLKTKDEILALSKKINNLGGVNFAQIKEN